MASQSSCSGRRFFLGSIYLCSAFFASIALAAEIVSPAPTGVPVQYPVKQSKQEGKGIPPELIAILQSIFGLGGGMSPGFPGTSYENAESFTPDIYENIPSTAPTDLNTPFKILPPFRKYYDGCITKAGLGTCRFVNLGIKGDASHQARRSCHNSAQAIDVGPLTCSNGRKIIASDPEFYEVAKCMANETNDELQVIFYKKEGPNMMQKSDHNNHMHIQLKNCSMIYG